jgi:outer membrane immunogenic protein
MRNILLTTAVFGLFTLPGMAADMPVKAPPPVCQWCGFYIGGTAGGAWGENTSVDVVTTNTFINFPVLSPLGVSVGPASATATSGNISVDNRRGFTGGFEAGYNWQFENFVAGFETDIEGVSGSGSAAVAKSLTRNGFPGLAYNGTVAVSEKVNYLGTVRGRLGFLVAPTWLFYGTGGLAYGGTSSSTALAGAEAPNSGTTDVAGGGSTSGTRAGWTAGLGAEWMFMPHWTVKAEWLHYDLGRVTYSNGTMTGFLTGTTTVNFRDASNSTVTFAGDIVRAGLNYKF